jgi:hypothetical protein
MAQIYCVIDCSGSMDPHTDRTISGFNEFVQSSDPDSDISLITFCDKVMVVYENIKVKNAPPLDKKKYKPSGCTALLDGVGHAIELATKYESKNWADDEKTVTILIMTDGDENSSIKYTKPVILESIETKKKDGWNFIFMGANQDAIKTASDFSIDADHSLTFTTRNIDSAFRSASCAINRNRRGETVHFTQTERTVSN